jgi:Holliday junction resolvase RusA-like endonuclease
MKSLRETSLNTMVSPRMIEIVIPIPPMGAVRMTQRSKWADPKAKSYLHYKESLGFIARSTIKEPIKGPISVTLGFYYPIPASWSKKKKELAYDMLPTVKPDIDNAVKGVFDALNKIAWEDDDLITDLMTFKRYSEEPKILIKIQELIP